MRLVESSAPIESELHQAGAVQFRSAFLSLNTQNGKGIINLSFYCDSLFFSLVFTKDHVLGHSPQFSALFDLLREVKEDKPPDRGETASRDL